MRASQEVIKLGPAWTKLDHHPVQDRFWRSTKRFRVAACGRRSGKSELGKRIVSRAALMCPHSDGWFIACAPTRDQAKKIFWRDLKALIPKWAVDQILESELTIRLKSGVEISVIGMDKPERAEGRILDGALLDEYANMNPDAWDNHVGPALSTKNREGWAVFTGTPEGRNHFYEIYNMASDPQNSKHWEAFTWPSSDVISAEEIELKKRYMDPLIFKQEYEASFISFEGRAYYSFQREIHSAEQLRAQYYDKTQDLIGTLDFNVNPGTAAIGQECRYVGANPLVDRDNPVTMWFGEVWIPKGSNTKRVCDKIIADWGDHEGRLILYGDATGGNKGTQATEGSDWDIVRNQLRPIFGNRLRIRIGAANPRERARVNAVNSRLMTADGRVHSLIDPQWCPHLVEDYDNVTTIPGTDGELDKDSDDKLTHLTDGNGYYHFAVHPTTKRVITSAFK